MKFRFVTYFLFFLSFKAAEKHFKDAYNRIKSSHDSYMVEKWEPLLNNLGHTYRKLKKYEESLQYHHQVMNKFKLKIPVHFVRNPAFIGIIFDGFRHWCYPHKMQARIQRSAIQTL